MAAKLIDITGQRFGLLVVTGREKHDGERRWRCECDCGGVSFVTGTDLRTGKTRSCGCRERISHGLSRTGDRHELYTVWQSMKQRCGNPREVAFPRYGGRGIKVCERWMDDFAAFLADVGERPPGMLGNHIKYTIERIDNDGNYEPGNVRWATMAEQAQNRHPPTQSRRKAS